MKKNNKGFILVETLVVSVAIAAIFTAIYVNLVPVLGEYEKVESYDDLDTKYIAHWMRMLIIKRGNSNLFNSMKNLNSSNYINLSTDTCNAYFTDANDCLNFFNAFNVTKIYVTTYNIEGFKSIVRNNSTFASSPGFQNYTLSLPNFNYDYTGSYRILVEVEHNTNLKESDDYYRSYATVEVNKNVTTLR